MSQYEFVCGIETHVELNTKSKLFCGCENSSQKGNGPNTRCCPVCLGMPGTLPVLNEKAIELAIRASLALNCAVNYKCRMARKNYFYPDLVKGYQISQSRRPIGGEGLLELPSGNCVRIKRVHLEEDAGKISYDSGKMLIDYNRSGIPLVEIVSEPDLVSLDMVREYLETVRLCMIYAGVSLCELQNGQMRFDVNISVRKKGEKTLGRKVEIKNINSVNFVVLAIQYEFERQSSVLSLGSEICQETRGFDERSGETFLMRKKETESDYRYFADPDVPTFYISEDKVEKIEESLPVMPVRMLKLFVDRFGVDKADAQMLIKHKSFAEFFRAASQYTKNKKFLAKFILNQIIPNLKQNSEKDIFDCNLSSDFVGRLSEMLEENLVATYDAKDILKNAFEGKVCDLSSIRKKQVDELKIKEICQEVITKCPGAVKDFENGKNNALDYLVGKVLQNFDHKINPSIIKQILVKILDLR